MAEHNTVELKLICLVIEREREDFRCLIGTDKYVVGDSFYLARVGKPLGHQK